MKINEYNQMMAYLTRKPNILSNNINKTNTGRVGLAKGTKSDTKTTPKNSKILNYVNDTVAMYEPDKATKEQLEGLEKRLANARAYTSTEKKKMSKQDEYDTYFNKKSPKYYNKERVAGGEYNRVQEILEKIRENKPLTDDEKKELDGLIKTLTAKKIPVIPPKPDLSNGHTDWTTDDWLQTIDEGGWVDDRRRAGILEQDLANEYWQTQYENYQNNGGTLSYQQWMQQQLNLKVDREINKRVKDKLRTEGIAQILGVDNTGRKI